MDILKNSNPRVKKALDLMYKLHKDQKDKISEENIPYTEHLLGVTEILAKYTDDEDIIIAGLLHDTIEDTDYTFEKLEKDFGKKVLELVRGVTEDMELKTTGNKPSTWQDRKTLYLNHLKSLPEEVMMISIADRTENLKSLIKAYQKQGNKVFEKFNAPKERQAWFLKELDKKYKESKSKIYKEYERAYKDIRQRIFYL